MKLHALVGDLGTARQAVAGGATVLQLRLKDLPTDEVVKRGRAVRDLAAAHGVTFVVNDDLAAALRLAADGVHLGQTDEGRERAVEHGLLLGLSAASVQQACEAEAAGAAYVGAGPIWATSSKADAGTPIGLDGLAAICRAVSIPVVAIGGADAANAGDCIRAGAAGVAVIRAVADTRALREAIDAAG